MLRRRFLRDALLGAAAYAAAPRWLRAQVPAANAAAQFNERLRKQPWLAAWSTVGRESLGPTSATIEGRLPAALGGVLYRTGPAWFDRAGFRYRHLFDGDGMAQAWRIAAGTVEHRARMVMTPKFVREQRAGRFLVPAAGTEIPDSIAIRNNDDLNTANTSVIRLGDRLFALWEGGSAFELDPDDLSSRGLASWREDLNAAPFSAHPLLEADGMLWNFGSLAFLGGSGLLIWRIGPDGRRVQTAILESPVPGYLHSFAMSQRHLIFMFMPIDRGHGAAFFDSIRFKADQPCRVAVVPKDSLGAPLWIEVDFAAVYHFAGAWERGGEIAAHAVRHRDPERARAPLAAAMRGERDGTSAGTELATLRLDLAQRRARWETCGVENLEFPTYDARTPGTGPVRVFAPISVEPADAPYFNAIASIDVERERRDVHRYGPRIMAEEHLFVPKPGARRRSDGWLLGTLLDYERGRSGIAVLDAEHVSDGPLATAWVPYTVPLGLHGWFAGSRGPSLSAMAGRIR